MTIVSILTLLIGLVAGFILGANHAASKACQFTHDWKQLSSRLQPGYTTTTKHRCTTCGKTRAETVFELPE
jgi:hypothetical protein